MNRLTKQFIVLGFFGFASGCNSTSQDNKINLPYDNEQIQPVTVQTDFTDASAKFGEIFDFFDVSVRTERGNPKGIPAHFGRAKKVNTVRMLGGWYNQDLYGDTYQWDGEKYVYNFEAATNRIDAWLGHDWEIFQIVLDNPPWAFQRGYKFVDEPDGKHYLAKDRVGVYGNGLPPNDAKAWSQYIQAFIEHLVDKYGSEMVLSWRFRVGSEIDTRPQHWSATREAFFDHYKNTVEAVHAVLPEAKIGAHFREASFTSRYVDYTGNKEDSYAVPFVKWAKQNDVAYDFLAVSFYPHIVRENELDLEHVYKHDIAPVQLHPDFYSHASVEIHEFKFISKMVRAGFVSVATSHGSAFFAKFAKMMLENNIRRVFQWGNHRQGNYSADAMTQLALVDMVGNQHFKSETLGESVIANNEIEGIFSQNSEHTKLTALLYSFNNKDFSYQPPEPARIAMIVKHPVGSAFKYRSGKINRFNNIEDQFYAEFPLTQIFEKDGGWRINKIHQTASPSRLLNDYGQKVFAQHKNKYGKADSLQWSQWQQAEVVEDAKGNNVVIVDTRLESFEVQKLEVYFELILETR